MKVHRFKLSGGEAITLNDAQLYALHHMPAQYVSWPTYWALRRLPFTLWRNDRD